MHAEPADHHHDVGAGSDGEPTGWLDLARILAIGAVVMVHEGGKGVGSRAPGDPATAAWWAADVLDGSSRWCVPVFLMVSGALLLDPRRTEPPGEFYRRRLARIGLPLVVWTAAYLWFGHVFLDRPAGVGDLARAVGSGSPFLQLYYLYVIAGLYLLAPFLRAALRTADRRGQAVLVGALLAVGVTDQALMSFVRIGEANAATRFMPYLGYFVAGWVLRDLPPRPAYTRAAAVALPVSLVVTWLGGGLAAAGGRGWGPYGEYAFSYLAPNVIVMSFAAFWLVRVLATRPDRWRPGPVTARLAGLTFGIFLVHALIWYPLVRDWEVPAGLGAYAVAAAWHWLVALAGSAVITAALRRVPLARRLV